MNRRNFLRGLFAVPVATAITLNTKLNLFGTTEGLAELPIVSRKLIYPQVLRDYYFMGSSPIMNYLYAEGKIKSFDGGVYIRQPFVWENNND